MQSYKEIIVYTYGAFDLLHPAHIMLLENAKKLGTKLFVGVLADEPIKIRKGLNRPIQKYADRALIVESLRCVDAVFKQDTYNPVENILKIGGVSILTKGDDWEACEISASQTGCRFEKLYYNNDYSTSNLVEKIKNGSSF